MKRGEHDEAVGPEGFVIRYVASVDELTKVFQRLSDLMTPGITDADRLLDKLILHFPEDRRLNLVMEKDGQIVGGVLGSGSTLGPIAVVPEHRGKGLGRRLVQTFELGAMQKGIQMISLGARKSAKGFYLSLGYGGRSSMHKGLPLPGRVLEWRLRKLEALVGNLETGQAVQTDASGKVPPLELVTKRTHHESPC